MFLVLLPLVRTQVLPDAISPKPIRDNSQEKILCERKCLPMVGEKAKVWRKRQIPLSERMCSGSGICAFMGFQFDLEEQFLRCDDITKDFVWLVVVIFIFAPYQVVRPINKYEVLYLFAIGWDVNNTCVRLHVEP